MLKEVFRGWAVFVGCVAAAFLAICLATAEALGTLDWGSALRSSGLILGGAWAVLGGGFLIILGFYWLLEAFGPRRRGAGGREHGG